MLTSNQPAPSPALVLFAISGTAEAFFEWLTLMGRTQTATSGIVRAES